MRLVATDLDGTLVRSDGSVSSRTRAALAAAEAAGATVVLATGRPIRWMHAIAEATGHRGVAICANGAIAYDLHSETVVESHLIEPGAVIDVVAALRREIGGIAFAMEHEGGFDHEPGYLPRWPTGDSRIAAAEELATAPLIKLLARHEDLGADELLARARAAVGDAVSLTHGSDRDCLLEISAAGVSKAAALQRLAERAGLSSYDAVAFGDMPNDVPMLTWAGHGVAVANAHPEVLEVADEVTTSNDDDGVAVVLERLFP